MATRLRKWTGLGLSAAVLGAAACADSEVPSPPAEQADAADEGAATAAGEAGEGGEGGEGEAGAFDGEGGVDVARAAEDPAVYRIALAVVEAHALAAQDAAAAGEVRAAAEMFAHPVSEVLLDMQPVFAAQGAEPVDPLLLDASAGVFAGETPQEIAARVADIGAALAAAAALAPETDEEPGRVAARVAADMIARAAYQYRAASASDAYEPYLDGYGFLAAARVEHERSRTVIRAYDADIDALISDALETLAVAYPAVARPPSLEADQGALNAASTQLFLALDAG